MLILDVGVQGHDGGEVHRVHIVGCSSQDGLDDEAQSTLCRVESVPKSVDIPVWTQVG